MGNILKTERFEEDNHVISLPEVFSNTNSKWSVIVAFSNFQLRRSVDEKHFNAGFWDADCNRKRTFRVLGPHCLPDFYASHLFNNGGKILGNVNLVWGRVKRENWGSLSTNVLSHGRQPEVQTSPLWCVFHPFHSESQAVNVKMRAL